MPALALRLPDRQLKAVKAKDKDYVLSDGDGLQLRVRSNGSMLWNFNYREPVSIKLTLSDPKGRVLWASCVSFSRFVHNVLHGDSVLYDNHFGFTDIP